jgi:hypothetical protein
MKKMDEMELKFRDQSIRYCLGFHDFHIIHLRIFPRDALWKI